jgi:hypothetical protein
MPSAESRVFLSYKHGPMTPVVEKFYRKLKVNGPGIGLAGTFMDAKAIHVGAFWRAEVEQALEQTTHFVAFLDDDYWLSDECQKELQAAVDRFVAADGIVLLFVKAGEIAPELLKLQASAAGAAAQPQTESRRQLQRVGDLQFLGPFNAYAQLLTLAPPDKPQLLDEQLFQLFTRLHDRIKVV